MAIVKHKAGSAGNEVVIWAETANINYFLNTNLTPTLPGTVVNKTSTVSNHARRQYPSDPTPSNVGGGSRRYMYDPGSRNGSALPGKNFWLVSDEGLPGEERRQFTYQGKLIDLHAFLRGNVKMAVTLFGPTGKRYTLTAAPANP